MRSRIIKGLLGLGAAWLCVTGTALAQNREKAWELYPYVGYVRYGAPNLGDTTTLKTNVPTGFNTTDVITSTIDNNFSFGFRFAYNWTKHQEVEFGFGGNSTKAQVLLTETMEDILPPLTTPPPTYHAGDLSVDFLVGQANYTFNFFPTRRDRLVLYVSAGVGLVNTSVFGNTADPLLTSVYDDLVGDEVDLMYNYGGGVRLFGGRRTGGRLEIRQFKYSAARGDQDYLEVTLGLSIVVGGA
jgi:hypothetical protein